MLKKNRNYLIICLVAATTILLICSKSSPLYPMNDWVDVQGSFTVGKGIIHGIVPYKDLYEQRGPVFYFLFALTALISEHSFIGVFLIEIASSSAFLYISMKLIALYLGNSTYLYALPPIFILLICTSRAYSHGSSVETFSLWLLAYALFTTLQALHDHTSLTKQQSFLIGMSAAAVLYTKFTMFGFYVGLAFFVVIWYLIYEKDHFAFFYIAVSFLSGLITVTIPIFFYFIVNNAWNDFFIAYFYNNIFLYPKESTQNIAQCLITAISNNLAWGLLMFIGIIWMLLRLPIQSKESLASILSFLGLSVSTYWGGRGYSYYFLIFCVYTPLGIIALGKALQQDFKANAVTLKNKDLAYLFSATCMSISIVLSVFCSNNTYLLGKSKKTLPPYQFAQTINSIKNATLLNYGFLDGGFYYAANILPSCKYFCTLNIPLEDMWHTHKEAIENNAFDFIITRQYTLESYGLQEGYKLVDTANHYFEGIDFTYYLYQNKKCMITSGEN